MLRLIQKTRQGPTMAGLECRRPRAACSYPDPVANARGAPDLHTYQLCLLPLVPILLGQQVADDLDKVLEMRASEREQGISV